MLILIALYCCVGLYQYRLVTAITSEFVYHVNECVTGKSFNRFHNIRNVSCIADKSKSDECLPNSNSIGLQIVNCR